MNLIGPSIAPHPPNASELIKIVSSAKFGGGNYWLAGATGAKLIISLVNNIWPKVQSSLDLIEPDEMGFVVLQPTFVGHLMHYLHIFPTLAGHLGTIDPDDYRHAKEISHFLFLEKENLIDMNILIRAPLTIKRSMNITFFVAK